MIHGQSGVKLRIMSEPEEPVRRIRSESHKPFSVGRFHGRKDYPLLLVAKQAAVPAMRIQSQHRDLRLHDAEIPLQRRGHQPQFVHDLLLRDRRRNIL